MLHHGDIEVLEGKVGSDLAVLFGKYVRGVISEKWSYERLTLAWLAAFERERPLFDHILKQTDNGTVAMRILYAEAERRGVTIENLVFQVSDQSQTIFDMSTLSGAATALICPDFDLEIANSVRAYTGEQYLVGWTNRKFGAGEDTHYDAVVARSLKLVKPRLPSYALLQVGIPPATVVELYEMQKVRSSEALVEQILSLFIRGVDPLYSIYATLEGVVGVEAVIKSWESGVPLDYLVTSHG